MRKACKNYPDKSKHGCDMLGSKQLAMLPSQIMQEVVKLLKRICTTQAMPLQTLLNLMVLLPKPRGGERTIALTCILYRFLRRVTKVKVEERAERGQGSVLGFGS